MKKVIVWALLLMCTATLAACGAKEAVQEAVRDTLDVSRNSSGNAKTMSEESLFEEGFTQVEATTEPEYTVDEIVAALQNGEPLSGAKIMGDPGAYALSLLDTSGFENLEGYTLPDSAAIPFDNENWPSETGLVTADWQSELSEEDQTQLDNMMNYDASQSELFALLPEPPGAFDPPLEAENTLVITARGVTRDVAAAYFEACKQAGFNQYTEEMDMSSYGMGFMWTASDSSGRVLTLMLNGDSLQIMLEGN